MAKIPYFPFYPDDWLSSSRVDLLTAEQERGYLRLLCRSWNMPECILPDNEPLLLKWSRMPSADDLRTLCQRFADGMEPLFVRVGKGWRNPKLHSLWLKAQDKHEKAVENASARYKKKSEPADAERTQSGRTANQNQNQNQNQKKKRTKKPLIPMPENFCMSDEVKVWALKKGFGNLEEHLESFKLKAASKEYRYADWDAALKNAIRDDWAKIRVGGNGNGKNINGKNINGDSRTGERAEPGKYAAALSGKTGIAPE